MTPWCIHTRELRFPCVIPIRAAFWTLGSRFTNFQEHTVYTDERDQFKQYNNIIRVIDTALSQRLWIDDVITQLLMTNQRPQMKTFGLVAFLVKVTLSHCLNQS